MPSEQPGLILPNVDQRLQAHAEKQMLLNQLRWQWAGQCMAAMLGKLVVPTSPDKGKGLSLAGDVALVDLAVVSFSAADAMLAEMGHKPVHLKKPDLDMAPKQVD